MTANAIIYNRTCGESVTFGFNVEKVGDSTLTSINIYRSERYLTTLIKKNAK